MVYSNQLKSEQMQINVGKMGVPELNWHPVDVSRRLRPKVLLVFDPKMFNRLNGFAIFLGILKENKCFTMKGGPANISV